MTSIELVTDRLLLRPFIAEDLPALVAYRSDPEVARYQSWDAAFSMADAERFLESQRTVRFGASGQWLQLAVLQRKDRIVVGDCAIRVIAGQPATAELGVTLSRDHQGRGIATEALDALLTALLQQHGLHRVFAEVDDRNAPVQRLLSRLGFRCEARLVEADWFKEQWTTVRIYALLQREWTSSSAGPAG
jgi:RimJ/RimL family protein N-acetyltransferase